MKREERENDNDIPPAKRLKVAQLNHDIIFSYNAWEVRGTRPQPLKYYVPQEGDECYFIRESFKLIIQQVKGDDWDNEFIRLYLEESLGNLENLDLQEMELCRVKKIEYLSRQPRSDVVLTLTRVHLHVPRLGITFFINYVGSPICQSKRFLILKELFEYSRKKFLQDPDGILAVGKRITVFFNQYYDIAMGEKGIYGGTINKVEFGYNGLTIDWDDAGDDESEKFRSVWDVLEIGEEEFVKEFHDNQFKYETSETPPGEEVGEYIELRAGYRAAAKRIQKFMFTSQLFNYTEQDPYPVYLSTIKDRCLNFFYRRHLSLLNDLRHVLACGRKQESREDIGPIISKTCAKLETLISNINKLFERSQWKPRRKKKASGSRRSDRDRTSTISQSASLRLGGLSSSEEEEEPAKKKTGRPVPKSRKDGDFVLKEEEDEYVSEYSDDDDGRKLPPKKRMSKKRKPARRRKAKKKPPKKKKTKKQQKMSTFLKKKKKDPDGEFKVESGEEDEDEDDDEELDPEAGGGKKKGSKRKRKLVRPPPKKKRGRKPGPKKPKVDKKALSRALLKKKTFSNEVEEDEDYVPPRSVSRLYQDKKKNGKKVVEKKVKKGKVDDVTQVSELADDDLDTILLNNEKLEFEDK